MRIPELALAALLLPFGMAVGVAGCDVDEGPAEETGESLDEAGDELEDAADDTA